MKKNPKPTSGASRSREGGSLEATSPDRGFCSPRSTRAASATRGDDTGGRSMYWSTDSSSARSPSATRRLASALNPECLHERSSSTRSSVIASHFRKARKTSSRPG